MVFAGAPGAGLRDFLAGCIGGGSEPQTVAANQQAAAEQIDVRRYLGPDYCPELRVRESTEVVRHYERGHENDARPSSYGRPRSATPPANASTSRTAG